MKHFSTVIFHTCAKCITPFRIFNCIQTTMQITMIDWNKSSIFLIQHKLSVSYFCSVSQSCWTLCNPMDCSTPGFPVFHYVPEFAQTQVHWVSDAIQPSHPLLPPSPPALNLFQHQSLFQWVGSLQDSQGSSPAPQFESINSSALGLLYGPTLPSVHDCWKKHSFHYMDLCWQSDVSTF